MRTLIDTINELFLKDNTYIDESGNVLLEKIKTSILKMDEHLIELLLSDTYIKETFFKEVNGIQVFDKVKFIDVINSSQFLPNSYTSFKNKIGLASDNNFLKPSNDVVLDFAFKDCLLVGGQTKEDVAKKHEVFFNFKIAGKQIDYLLEPKALKPVYFFDGKEKKVSNYKDENLIIKGNNLLALSSLLPRFRNKVKLIFIDPPYNTENDTFKYNDTFNHSTWLTFMKNRLELAKELLTPDGSIYVSIDYNEVHYLKVLMDEVFGRESFQREIIWRIGWLSGYKTTAKNYIRNHDTILYYTKSPDNFVFNKFYLNRDTDFQERFNNAAIKEIKQKIEDAFPLIPSDFFKDFIPFIQNVGLPEQYPLEDTWNCSIYDKLNSIAVVSFSGEKVSKMLGVDEIKGQKAEKLIKRIIETSSNEGDLVLDFFLGSGTTAAAAHKMNRRYIGVEQMEYVKDTACERLKKVVLGEDNSGITEETGWKGGGSFVYAEMLELNQEFVEKVLSADNLEPLFDEIVSNGFIVDYKADVDYLKSKEGKEEFLKLSIEEQKKVLLDILEYNILYVNQSELDDEKYKEFDRQFSDSFYKIGK